MAFGKKNTVNLNPLAYNFCLLGISKIGKTTIIKEMCEKLAGADGYLFLEIGQERGADAIEGINFVNCPEWSMDYDELTNSVGFIDVVNDILENKTTEYPNLKVIVWDTYDQLINVAEQESIRLWNKECRAKGAVDKTTTSINAAWGGFGKGEKKAMELMFNAIADLRAVGVSTIIIGHCKTKDITDPITGDTYQVVTSDQQRNYFDALKKNLHFLGLAYIDREIVKEKTGKRNAVTHKEEVINRVTEESRKIKFRDDNYAVDSGSRFADIVDEIPMTADALINALTDAILSEQAKSGVDIKKAKKAQAEFEKAQAKQVVEHEKENKAVVEREKLIKEINEYLKANKTSLDVIKPIIAEIKKRGVKKPDELDSLDDVIAIHNLISQ